MESHIKDKHIILGFIGVSICLISMLITLYVAESFNQDNFVRLVVFVCSNLLGWLLYFSFQTVIFDLYEIYKIKSSKKRMHYSTRPIETKQMEYAIAPELHEKNRIEYEGKEECEKDRRISMVMEYIHYVMPRIADKETVDHICGEVNSWMNIPTYKPKPITRQLTKEVTNIALRHFVWNISERFMYKKYYNGENRANFIKALFPQEFSDTDIATIKNFRVDPLKTPIPIDEPEAGSLDFHYPADYVREEGH